MSLVNIRPAITLDIYDHNLTPSTIKAIALDSGTRFVAAMIRDRGEIYDIGQDADVALTVLRPDKTRVQITGETSRISRKKGCRSRRSRSCSVIRVSRQRESISR